MRESFVGLGLFSDGLRRRQRLARSDLLGLSLRLFVIEELLVDAGSGLLLVDRDRLVLGQFILFLLLKGNKSLHWFFLDFLRCDGLLSLWLGLAFGFLSELHGFLVLIIAVFLEHLKIALVEVNRRDLLKIIISLLLLSKLLFELRSDEIWLLM